jgi:hypothetical protein
MVSKMMRWTGHVVCMGAKSNAYRVVLVVKLEGKRSLGRPGHRWKNNIVMI